jgi:hypothetical protein
MFRRAFMTSSVALAAGGVLFSESGNDHRIGSHRDHRKGSHLLSKKRPIWGVKLA